MRYRTSLKLLLPLLLVLYAAPSAMSSNVQSAPNGKLANELHNLVSHSGEHPEKLMVDSLDAVRNNRLDEALRLIDQLIAEKPNYRLAHLVKGDLLLARSKPLQTLGDVNDAPADKLSDLRQEAMVRHARWQNPPPADRIPANLVQLTPSQTHAIVVDTQRSRLYLFRNDHGVPRLVLDHYVTIGKLGADKNREGDQRTPLGVYFVTGKLPREQLDKTYGAQADLYGVGAWPLSYPNEWDRSQGKTGHGIWLHGSPADTYSRPPLASNGCVVLTNPDIAAIAAFLQPGTPVVISQEVSWLDEAGWLQRRQQLLGAVEHWRQDWESLDTNRYLAHYGQQFHSGKADLAAWRQQKLQVNAGKRWAKVELANLSLFAQSGPQAMLVATFDQNYQSSNLSNQMRKRLYWRPEGQNWRIVYESAV